MNKPYLVRIRMVDGTVYDIPYHNQQSSRALQPAIDGLMEQGKPFIRVIGHVNSIHGNQTEKTLYIGLNHISSIEYPIETNIELKTRKVHAVKRETPMSIGDVI